MTDEADREQEIERLLEAAARLDPEARPAFLAAACAGDPSLEAEVKSLLDRGEPPQEFLERPAWQLAAAWMAPEQGGGELSPGTQVGPYRVISRVGSGGMGEVYEARDTRLERAVALKFLPRELSEDPQALERFQREARAASALNHPHICTLHDVGEHQGRPFLVMELLEGQSLKERLAAGPAAVPELLELALQITEALEAAHGKGIVHRDIKPANIFLSGPASGRPGPVKILDFGLAKLVSDRAQALEAVAGLDATALPEEHTITRPGAFMGTAAYMSPEQARGEPVDARTDLFSLGVTLYQMATGSSPFHQATPQATVEAILHKQPVRPRELVPQLPAELERIILRAVEKDRAARYQSAAELRADLEGLRPAQARVARWLLAVAAMLVAALGVTLIGIRSGWFAGPPSTVELTPRQVTANASENPVVKADISPDGQYLAYTDLAGLHVRRIDTGEIRTIPPPEGCCFR